MEWHFADFAGLKAQGRRFDCDTCPKTVRKVRKCRLPRWDLTSEDGPDFPLVFMKSSTGLSFCPAKLFRDDPGFVSYCKKLFVMWKTGMASDEESVDAISEELADDLYYLIMSYESAQKSKDYDMLGKMIGGG